MKSISLGRALRDPRLLGASFQGNSWRQWHTVAKLFSGEVLDPEERRLVLKCTGRTRLPEHPPRRGYLLVGRRGAKSRFQSAVAVHHAALARDWRALLAPGEDAIVMLLAVDKRQAAVNMRYCRGIVRASALLPGEIVRETENSIEFRSGGVIEVTTNDARAVRGRTVVALVGDESCFWAADGEGSKSDEEVLAAVEPSMAMVPDGGLIVLASSPFKKSGLMFNRWQRLFGNDDARDICWVAPSKVMNPLLPQEVIDQALVEDPARARSEYLAVWREDLTDFVPRDAIEAATDHGVTERPAQSGIRYVAFADAAGGTGSDSFTLGIAHAEPNGKIVLDALRERAPRFVPAAVVAEFAALLRAYGVTEVRGDRFSGAWCSDEFTRNGIQYWPSPKSKTEIYLSALPLLLSGRARLLDQDKLHRQFAGLVRRVRSNARETVDHGPAASAHDDLCNAAAGALVAAAADDAQILMVAPVIVSTPRLPAPGNAWTGW